MEVKDGYYTGNVEGSPPEGEQKVVQLAAWADGQYGVNGWELVAAYGDHRSDEPLLRSALCAVAVNPDAGLERIAKREGWRVVDWSK
jgi:phosphoserine phosphatase